MKIWVIGSQGMVGAALLKYCHSLQIEAVGTSRQEADICDFFALLTVGKTLAPTHIINCAAYTNVDEAETHKAAAFAVNAMGAEHVARVCKELGSKLIHLSTDYVFNGRGMTPYTEEDPCDPVNVYGMSKWEGEKKVLAAYPQACIVRTSWVFGSQGKNFISALLTWFEQKHELQVVFDQCGRPTWCVDLSRALLSLLGEEGIVHFAGEGARSRYQIAVDLMQVAKERGLPIKCESIVPVPSSQFPTRALRPAYSVLCTKKYEHLTSTKARPWSETLSEFLKDGL